MARISFRAGYLGMFSLFLYNRNQVGSYKNNSISDKIAPKQNKYFTCVHIWNKHMMKQKKELHKKHRDKKNPFLKNMFFNAVV